jgi:anti-sigma factor RsiW
MSPCLELAEALLDLVAGEVPPDRKAHFDGHLRDCPACVALLESYRYTIHVARLLSPAPLPPACAARLRAALEAGAADTRRARADGGGPKGL